MRLPKEIERAVQTLERANAGRGGQQVGPVTYHDLRDAIGAEIAALRGVVQKHVERIADQDAEITDWILVADGIKHDHRCPRHFAGDATAPPCLRCQRDDADSATRLMQDRLQRLIDGAVARDTEIAQWKCNNAENRLIAEENSRRSDRAESALAAERAKVRELRERLDDRYDEHNDTDGDGIGHALDQMDALGLTGEEPT